MSSTHFEQTPYSKIRNKKRAHYDRETILPILDSGMYAHVSFIENDRPMIIPMLYARIEDTLYLHGAKATRIIKSNKDRALASLIVTHVDGIVIARSAFHHSMNYRSVVVHGTLRQVANAEEKEIALIELTNHILPGRWDEVREMTTKEFNATGVLALEIEVATAKIREGGPIDDTEDYALDIWAGVLPINQSIGQPIDDGKITDNAKIPPSVFATKKKFV